MNGRPTLYANDVENASVPKATWAAGLDALALILPRPCGPCRGYGQWCHLHNVAQDDPKHDYPDCDLAQDCKNCDGRGFLFPDPPEWWWENIASGSVEGHEEEEAALVAIASELSWQSHLVKTLRAMELWDEQ